MALVQASPIGIGHPPIYMPLDPQEDEIRLLEITDRGYVLRSPVNLRTSRPRYIALSYPWGNAESAKIDILLHGQSFSVSQNLFSALHRLKLYCGSQYQDHSRQFLVWCDQICINQRDEAEKNHQVAFMKRIYGGAEEVLIWLPLGTAPSGDVSWALKSIIENRKLERENWLQSCDDRAWGLMRDILRSSWWSRAWVYQEFMLATRATFLIGGTAIPWSELHELLRQLMSLDDGVDAEAEIEGLTKSRIHSLSNAIDRWEPKPRSGWERFMLILGDIRLFFTWIFMNALTCCSYSLDDLEVGIENLHRRDGRDDQCRPLHEELVALKNVLASWKAARASWPTVSYILEEKAQRSRQTMAPLSLHRLLLHMRTCGCADPRDRVFAILGLASSSCGLQADYSPQNNLANVTTETTIACIRESLSLDFVLDFFEDKRIDLDEQNSLPGWIPDLSSTVKEDGAYKRFVEHLALPTDCQASKEDATVSFEPDHQGRPNRVLKAQGNHIANLNNIISDDTRRQLTRFAVTDARGTAIEWQCLTRSSARPGDQVWILRGLRVPICLSPLNAPGQYAIIGHTAIYNADDKLSDVMYGSLDIDPKAAAEHVMIL